MRRQFGFLKLAMLSVGIMIGAYLADFLKPYLWLVGLMFLATAIWVTILWVGAMGKTAYVASHVPEFGTYVGLLISDQEPPPDRSPRLRQDHRARAGRRASCDLRLAGFLTLELREHGERVGFEAVGLGGERAILAHVRFRSPVSVGRYGIEPDRLVPLIEEELVRPAGTVDAYLIDEIGKMDRHCPQFVAVMRKLLETPVPFVATIALRGGGFIAEVKTRPDVLIVEVTQGNRNTLSGQIAAWVKQQTDHANTP